MIFYEFRRPGQERIKQNEVIFDFDELTFYKVEDLNNIGEFYKSYDKDYKNEEFNLVTFLPKGIKSFYDEETFEKIKKPMTEEEKEKALEIYKEIKKIKLKKYFDNLLKHEVQVLEIEKATWETQKNEAMLYKKDKKSDVPFIKALAKSRGISLDELVEKIIKKAKEYNEFVASNIGRQHKLENEIEKCNSYEEVLKLDLPEFCKLYIED